MRYRKLSSTGDYTFGGGQLNFWRDVPEAVGQAAQTRLLLWQGEWYQDINEGTPYIAGVIGKHGKTTADVTIQDRILGTQGATNVSNYTSVIDPVTRIYSETKCDLDTIYGPTPLQVSNYANY